MTSPKTPALIELIPIDKIHVLNPRVRNKKIFSDITENIAKVGLKRPITVTQGHSKVQGKEYDLVCGQGRLEAFIACGQTHIPAIVIEASEEQALIMSLVENLARRHHLPLDMLQGIEILRKQGYNTQDIAQKTGLSDTYVYSLLNLMERGEERLIAAVEAGHIPVSIAARIADTPDEAMQQVLHDLYESDQLRGKRLLLAKDLIESRRRIGKSIKGAAGRKKPVKDNFSAQDVMKIYQKEVDRKRLMTRKAEFANNRMLFITEALRRLLREDHFNTLLKAEGLITLPRPLADLVAERK